MKTKLFTLLFSSFVFLVNAQSNQTLSLKNKDTISYKNFIAPAALVTAGIVLLKTNFNNDLQTNTRKLFGNSFHTSVDNIIPLAPVVQIYLGKYLGFQPKNDFQHQTINIVIANVIMGTVGYALKNAVGEERPDHSDNLSFPSVHTATGFTNATLLFYEYKDSDLGYASSGFLFATATGVLRMANNKHYTSDILAGAGIGIATGIIVSYWNPFKSVNLGKKKNTTAFIYPQIGNQIGMGAIVRLH
jgi:membrane-associated phospholipid phosphatase